MSVGRGVGDTGSALGNAIGSCICNIGLYIGICDFARNTRFR
jgi:Ca2+/Na+ antiporter